MDRSPDQHVHEWTQRNAPLFWVEMIYTGDIRFMKKYIGFSFGNHYFRSRGQATSFYMNTKTAQDAEQFGSAFYSSPAKIRKLLSISKHSERRLLVTLNEINNVKLSNFTYRALRALLGKYFRHYATLIGIYRFTRPTFYQSVIEKIERQIPAPQKNLAALLQNDFEQLTFNPSKKLKELVILLKKVGVRRLKLHEQYLDAFIRAQPIFKEIARRFKVRTIFVQNATLRELKQWLSKKEIPDRAELNQRINYFEFKYFDGFYTLETKGPEQETQHSRRVALLKGRTAYPGVVRGKAKIMLESLHGVLIREIQKMHSGDILVTTSTSPDMMIALKKAGAIVTDVGGLLSHAAIVSRELGIPCIIGTKIATKIFKDGDLVEVDADKGIVRILNKKEPRAPKRNKP